MFQSVWSVGSGASLLVGLFCADRRSGFCGSRRPDRPKRNSAKSQGVFSHGGRGELGACLHRNDTGAGAKKPGFPLTRE